MSIDAGRKIGQMTWFDLTVDDAPRIRDFYERVVGWTTSPHDMGDYSDFNVHAPGVKEPISGIIQKRGVNAELPSQWLVTINVDDLDDSMGACRELGGEIVHGPRDMGPWGRYCVIRDPAGAVMALMEPPPEKSKEPEPEE